MATTVAAQRSPRSDSTLGFALVRVSSLSPPHTLRSEGESGLITERHGERRLSAPHPDLDLTLQPNQLFTLVSVFISCGKNGFENAISTMSEGNLSLLQVMYRHVSFLIS